jgi:hypothetical protein
MPDRKKRGIPFRRGHDPRRHVLTHAERQAGGFTRWKMTMTELRQSMNLPLPFEPVYGRRKGVG